MKRSVLSVLTLTDFFNQVNYRKLCLLEKTGTPEIISPYKTYIMSAQEVVKVNFTEGM